VNPVTKEKSFYNVVHLSVLFQLLVEVPRHVGGGLDGKAEQEAVDERPQRIVPALGQYWQCLIIGYDILIRKHHL
jgi:hypothetical protein